jgi:YgiT-type zinc finger domain-containing protein
MICLICRQAEVVESFTSLDFQRGEMHLSITNVPARLCQSCGEAYMDEEVTAQVLQSAERIYRVGILEEIIDYRRLIGDSCCC